MRPNCTPTRTSPTSARAAAFNAATTPATNEAYRNGRNLASIGPSHAPSPCHGDLCFVTFSDAQSLSAIGNGAMRMAHVAALVATAHVIDHGLRLLMLHLEGSDQRIFCRHGNAVPPA